MNQSSYLDLDNWPLPKSSRRSSVSLSAQESESASLLSSQLPLPSTPATSPPCSESNQLSTVSEPNTRINLSQPVLVSFTKGGRLFKLQYSFIDVCKDATGSIKCLELGDSSGQQGAFIHTFQNTRRPIPHLEQPTMSSGQPSFTVSFLEAQTVQAAQTIFLAQPFYTFENSEDCVRFQEALFAQKLVFVAGVAEAKSKGRGEECISQNLRILRAVNGKQTILFFANSQRKERKRYVSIPINCISSIDQSTKAGRPISLALQPNFELLSQLKALQIRFLEEADQKQFHQILCQDVGG